NDVGVIWIIIVHVQLNQLAFFGHTSHALLSRRMIIFIVLQNNRAINSFSNLLFWGFFTLKIGFSTYHLTRFFDLKTTFPIFDYQTFFPMKTDVPTCKKDVAQTTSSFIT